MINDAETKGGGVIEKNCCCQFFTLSPPSFLFLPSGLYNFYFFVSTPFSVLCLSLLNIVDSVALTLQGSIKR